MRKARHLTAALIAAATTIIVGGLALAQPAGATLQYVNQMPVSFGTLLCYRDDTTVNGLRNYQCNLHAAGTGAFIRNDASWWADPTVCDSLIMRWNPNGADYVDIYNGSPGGDPTPPGEIGPRGCGTGYRGSGTQGMAQTAATQFGQPIVTALHGAQFLHYSVGGGSTICVNLLWPYNCQLPQEWHYRATWG